MIDPNAWIQTYSGRKVYPLELRPGDVLIEDIAHSLAMQCRFAGHTKFFYSVAQHSVIVSEACAPEDALWGLLHDASEAYLQDVVRPLKRTPEYEFYRAAEERAMDAICIRFGLPSTMPVSVLAADRRALATELRDLMSPTHPDWRGPRAFKALETRILAQYPCTAEFAFLDRYRALVRGR